MVAWVSFVGCRSGRQVLWMRVLLCSQVRRLVGQLRNARSSENYFGLSRPLHYFTTSLPTLATTPTNCHCSTHCTHSAEYLLACSNPTTVFELRVSFLLVLLFQSKFGSSWFRQVTLLRKTQGPHRTHRRCPGREHSARPGTSHRLSNG